MPASDWRNPVNWRKNLPAQLRLQLSWSCMRSPSANTRWCRRPRIGAGADRCGRKKLLCMSRKSMQQKLMQRVDFINQHQTRFSFFPFRCSFPGQIPRGSISSSSGQIRPQEGNSLLWQVQRGGPRLRWRSCLWMREVLCGCSTEVGG